MALGQAKTKDYLIGTAELRIGPMSMANKLTSEHSVGLVDTATVTVNQESATLEGGFPRQQIDTAIIKQTAEVTASLREFSKRNLQFMLGEGLDTEPTESVQGTLKTAATKSATTLTLAKAVPEIKAGTLIGVMTPKTPETLSICKVKSVATDSVTLETETPLLQNYGVGAIVYTLNATPVGAVDKTNYLAVQLIQMNPSTGMPIVAAFWKASITSGLNMASSADDFASTDITLSILAPTQEDLGGELKHLAGITATNPTGLISNGS